MMAQALNPTRLPNSSPTTAQPNTTSSQVLLASCSAILYVLRNQQWKPVFDSNVVKLQLCRLGPGNFILVAVDRQTIKEKINLRFNTVFKVLKNNFFSLLDNGMTVWGFNITGQAAEAQTFAIVIQNSLSSLKESHAGRSTGPPSPTPAVISRPEFKGDQQAYLSNICLALSDAISRGNEQFASDLARQLASHKALVRIRVHDLENKEESRAVKDNKIHVKIQVEDKQSAGCHFRLDVTPQTTINQLKQMVQSKYAFPAEIQCWIIGKRLPKASESLQDCGIKTSGSTLFLYLLSAKDVPPADPLPERRAGEERHSAHLNRASSESSLPNATSIHLAQEDLQFERVSAYDDIGNAVLSMPDISAFQRRQQVFEAPVKPAGWDCPTCTYRNSPTRPGCEMCSAERPADYRVPENYVPSERERARMNLERSGELLIQQDPLEYEDEIVLRH